MQTTSETTFETTVRSPRRLSLTAAHRRLGLRLGLTFGLAAAVALIPSSTYAATLGPLAQAGDFSITGFAASALTFVKQAWALVAVAEIFALIYYLIAYFTQGLAPALFQPVSGPWVKTAALIAIGGNIVMGVLVGLATASAGGWT